MTKTELYKAIEHHYGSGILWAFTDLIHEEREMKTKEEESLGRVAHSLRRIVSLFPDYGVSVKGEMATSEGDLGYRESRAKFNALTALEVMNELIACNDSSGKRPKQLTCTEYVKVTESIFDLKEEFEHGELYNKSLDFSGDFVVINSETVLFACGSVGNLYRRVEVTERDEFIEQAKSVWAKREISVHDLLSDLYDAGCRFVNGKE